MRLIDVNKLIDNLDAMIPDYDYSDTSMGIATAIQEAGRMAVYEEVKAIPVEWMQNWMRKSENTYNREQVYEMLEEWEKENETNR